MQSAFFPPDYCALIALIAVNWMQMRGTDGISTDSPIYISLAVGFRMIEFYEIPL